MTGRYLTELADWLRAAGVAVIEVDGWQTRARKSGGYASGRPWCVMWHHTATNPGTDGQQDINYILTASSKPISNIYLDRAGCAWVCAAGATNTNGEGGPLTLSKGVVPVNVMNEYAVGMEIANNGVGEPYPQVQIDAAFTISNAVNAAVGNQPSDVGTHVAWTTRKIDPATATAVQGPWRPRSINSSGSWNLNDLRDECERRSITTPPTPTPPPLEDDVSNVLVLTDVRNTARYRCGPVDKSWIRDGNMAAQIDMRLAETAQFGCAQDGFRYTEMSNGNVDFIRSTGPIVGPRPAGVDEYGG